MSSQETPRRPTIADVAREAGVATSTASVVFSGKANVAAATRERVLAAAADLGYAGPDPRAASLRRGRSGIVAVVLEGHLRAAFLDPVTTAMMDGLTDGLADLSAGILLMRDEPGEEGAAITHAPVDAFVLIGCSGRTKASLEVVVGRGLPVVVIEGDAGGEIPRITLDNVAASADVARHVHDLGHRDVALVTLPLDSERERAAVTPERIANATVDVTVHRLEGMRQVFPDAPAISASGSLIDEGVLVGRMLLTDPATRPTAVLAQSDLLAVGVIRAAEELGLRVPEDLSVAGFDGIEVDGLGGLTLTTSVQPAVEKGRAAGEQVARMLGGEPGMTQHLTCVFRAGTTTGPVPR
ncbi:MULTISPECIES: LacI family DNA-binding transcriptional regulator [Microbacterium]|jgi:DNA-binding LacI/PurR family transcriptional regulator|uniref:LacI family DNA-binding transcriptional regulator n=1 Tax=Microbacterium maritypicum TaxID=33918 RepID=A0ACD4B650_MICMQ|nr:MULTISPECIES: LacI family DNA-binding transcriptional regulator [Microbacterium]EYT60717.1 transcriptional regulator [Microbacterium sp. UCD-TDU]MBP5802270.1 LacI family DNA-binding transcriptional regulator [Microbacterium liquefaciens]UTT53049.1 LacI family DNA-binding transcriptional regulator [Microbacterium liquefaciens]